MNKINKPLKELCKKIEDEYGKKMVYGKKYINKNNKQIIPVSIKGKSSHIKPVGLIEVDCNSVKFIRTEDKYTTLKLIIKIILIIVSILGIKKVVKFDKKWKSD